MGLAVVSALVILSARPLESRSPVRTLTDDTDFQLPHLTASVLENSQKAPAAIDLVLTDCHSENSPKGLRSSRYMVGLNQRTPGSAHAECNSSRN